MAKRAPKYEVFEGEPEPGGKTEWFWRLRAANGEIVSSSEGFTREGDAYRAAKKEAELARSAEGPEKP